MKNKSGSASQKLKRFLNNSKSTIREVENIDGRDDSSVEIDLPETSCEKSSDSRDDLLSQKEIDQIPITINNKNNFNPEKSKKPMIDNYVKPISNKICDLLLKAKLLDNNASKDIVNELKQRRQEKECQNATLSVSEMIQKLPYNDAINRIELLSSLKYYESMPEEYPYGCTQYNDDVRNLTDDELIFMTQDINIVDEYLAQIKKHVKDKEVDRIKREQSERNKIAQQAMLEQQLNSKLTTKHSKYDKYINQYDPMQPMTNNFIISSGKENCNQEDLQKLLNKKLGINKICGR